VWKISAEIRWLRRAEQIPTMQIARVLQLRRGDTQC
jgi:hypothetical protein